MADTPFSLVDPKGFNRTARNHWLASARKVRRFRDIAAGDPSVEFCIERAWMFHRAMMRA